MPYNIRSLRFNEGSTNEYASAGNILAFERTNQFSVSLWYRSLVLGAGGYLLGKMSNDSANRGWGIGLAADAKLQFTLRNNAATSDYLRVLTPAGTTNSKWKHAVFTYPGTSIAAAIKGYLQGSEATLSTEADALTGTIVTTDPFWIGGAVSAIDGWVYDGYLTQVCIYSDVLTAAEVEWLYYNGEPRSPYDSGAPDNLVLYYPVDGDTIPTIRDRSNGALATSIAASSVEDFRTGGTYVGSPQNMEAGDISSDSPGGVELGSLEFDGVNEWINFGNILAFSRYSPFSLLVWVKSTDSGVLLAKWCVTNPSGYIWAAGADSMSFGMVYSWASNGYYLGCTATGILDGNWHLAAITNSGAGNAGGIKFYLDAGLLTNGTPAFNNLASEVQHANPFTAAKDYSGADNPLAGKLCQASVWGKELSLAEIQWVYHSGVPRDLQASDAPSGLLGYWPLGRQHRNATAYNMESTDITDDVPERGITKVSRFSDFYQSELGTPQAFKELGRGHYKTSDGILQKSAIPTALISMRGQVLLGTTGGTAGTTYYWLRVRDSGLGPPPVYRMWVSEDPDSDPPPPGPTGSWVDRAMLGKWIGA